MATDRSDKNVLRLKILMDNSFAVDAVQRSSKTTPEVVRDIQWDWASLVLIQLQCVLYAGFCYNNEVTIVRIRLLRNSGHSINLQCRCNDRITRQTATEHINKMPIIISLTAFRIKTSAKLPRRYNSINMHACTIFNHIWCECDLDFIFSKIAVSPTTHPIQFKVPLCDVLRWPKWIFYNIWSGWQLDLRPYDLNILHSSSMTQMEQRRKFGESRPSGLWNTVLTNSWDAQTDNMKTMSPVLLRPRAPRYNIIFNSFFRFPSR